MRKLTPIVLLVVVAAAALLIPAAASAQSNFTVDPVQIYLSPDRSTAILTFTNHGDNELRLELNTFTWTHDEEGRMDLQPTEDVVLFPELVALEPGREQRVRIGLQTDFAPVEKAYRLMIAELPSGAAVEGGEVQLRTTVSIPVFLQQTSTEEGAIDFTASVSGRTVNGRIENIGNIHILADAVEFKGFDADDRVVFQENQPGWYILPGLAHRFDYALSDAACRSVVRVDAIAIGHGQLVSRSVDVTAACR